jgi:uncharacterized protein (DUF2235 family)
MLLQVEMRRSRLEGGMALGKRLVLCFDGTWNAADSERAETNVVKLARAIPVRAPSGELQLVLYLRGVGTGGLTDRVIGGALGEGVSNNLRSGYMFLAQNYEPGDDIYLFGFSRGAFTARSLSGFISVVGLLKRECLSDLFGAWQYYREPNAPGSASPFQLRCQQAARIKCVGVWDTVGALGVPATLLTDFNVEHFGFHNTQPSDIVDHAFHALAVDELRDEFVPTLWTKDPSSAGAPAPHVEQVWFAGAHSDVGGGYERDNALSDIPLVWMARRAESCGLYVDHAQLPSSLNPLAMMHDSRKRLSYSTFDRWRPTLRSVCETEFNAALNEKAYWPVDWEGVRIPTIGERLHRSVVERFGKTGPAFRQGEVRNETYRPKNLAPAVAKAQADPSLIAD